MKDKIIKKKIVKKDLIKKNSDFLKKKVFVNKKYIEELITCDQNVCSQLDIGKEGNLLRSEKSYLTNYWMLLHLINNIYSYSYISFPLLFGMNEKIILDKISILNQCQQEKIIFYIENEFRTIKTEKKMELEDIYQKNNPLHIVFLKHSNMENFVKVYFYNQCEKGEIEDFQIDRKNIIDILAYNLFTHSLRYYDKPGDKILSILLFYTVYIYLIRDEVLEKYGVDIRDTNLVENYEKLFVLLNKLGYVSKFYKTIYPKVKLLSTKVEKKIVNHPQYIEYLKYFNSYKPFADKILYDCNDIDIERLIQVHVPDNFDKKWILDQYKIIKENKNFGIRF